MNNKKDKKRTNFVYTEEFKTALPNPTEQELKTIFNKKYYLFIKRIENRFLRGCNFE